MEAIKRDFGSFANFKEKLTAVSVGVQGSGWGWLGYNKEQGRLQIAACANQDPLQGTTGLIPLLGIDVWEHAYYLQYKNVRPDYLKAIWNVINWENVSSRYESCRKQSGILAQTTKMAPLLLWFHSCSSFCGIQVNCSNTENTQLSPQKHFIIKQHVCLSNPMESVCLGF